MEDAGLIVITAFISPFIEDRLEAKKIIGENFFEIFIDTSLETCELRDTKGLYKKARLGEIKQFTGISSPYEIPQNPDLVVKTLDSTPEESTKKILDFLIEKIS
jgi:adenylylsulfate kinase-like enzyme